MTAGEPRSIETKYSKINEENFREKFKEWKNGENRDVVYVFHGSYLGSYQLESASFQLGIIIKISKI